MPECQHCERMFESEDSTADDKDRFCSQSCEATGEFFEESDEDSGVGLEDDDEY